MPQFAPISYCDSFSAASVNTRCITPSRTKYERQAHLLNDITKSATNIFLDNIPSQKEIERQKKMNKQNKGNGIAQKGNYTRNKKMGKKDTREIDDKKGKLNDTPLSLKL